ncbi:MAG: hypothetical protein ACREBW_00975, partial [Candidatus Micrarchaeaceae archaeon]
PNVVPAIGATATKVAVQHPFRGDVSYPLPMPKAWLLRFTRRNEGRSALTTGYPPPIAHFMASFGGRPNTQLGLAVAAQRCGRAS